MSSTNRSAARDEHIADYYVTPLQPIREFWKKFTEIEENIDLVGVDWTGNYLDPAAGGLMGAPYSHGYWDGKGKPVDIGKSNFVDVPLQPMSYPTVLKEFGVEKISTIDIRPDSLADIKANYLDIEFENTFDVIITNPPFNLAQEFIEKSLKNINYGGYVIMLLRLNFWGTQKRKKFLIDHMPYYNFIHSKRMSFTEDGKQDSIEYAHFVWKKEEVNQDHCRTYLI